MTTDMRHESAIRLGYERAAAETREQYRSRRLKLSSVTSAECCIYLIS
jgi:hypothetical protein